MHFSRTQNGFTLVETSIVLAIIALVIGGIWVGYASVLRSSKNARQDQQITDVLRVSRDYLQQFNETDTRVYSQPPDTVKQINQNLVDANLAPASLNGIAAGSPPVFSMEFGTAQVATLTSANNPYGTGPLVKIETSTVERSACLEMVNTWGGSPARIQSAGMVGITVNGTAPNFDADNLFKNVPADEKSLTSSQISTSCTLKLANIIALYFRLNP